MRALSRGRRLPAATALVAVLLGCASPAPLPPTPAGVAAEDAASGEVRQGLFRLRYRGDDGRGRVRLTLRSASRSHFVLEAVDTFGRRLWSFELAGGSSLLLDHRAREYCRLGSDVSVRAVALSELPVATLPRVLFGELPSPPAAGVALPAAGEIDFVAADGRRWSAQLEEGRPVSWTLWRQGAPLVWWLRAADGGGILSHRDGAQALWTTVAQERLAGTVAPLSVPADYSVGRCDADLP